MYVQCSMPKLAETFDANLLSTTIPKFCDDSGTLWKIYKYIETLKHKCRRYPNRLKKFITYQEEFLNLYERITTKEKEHEAKTGKPFKEPFSFFSDTSKRHKGLFRRLKYKKNNAPIVDGRKDLHV